MLLVLEGGNDDDNEAGWLAPVLLMVDLTTILLLLLLLLLMLLMTVSFNRDLCSFLVLFLFLSLSTLALWYRGCPRSGATERDRDQ